MAKRLTHLMDNYRNDVIDDILSRKELTTYMTTNGEAWE